MRAAGAAGPADGRRGYGRAVARIYDVASLEQVLYRQPRLRLLELLALTPGDTVLDLGCGTGLNFTPLLAAVGARGRIVGIDASGAMLSRARRRVRRSGTFTEQFNGTAWSVVPTPASQLINAVVDLSPTNAWATGIDISHWDGKSWKVVVANVAGGTGAGAITSVSATDLWAVGSSPSGTGTSTEHYNGTSWSTVPTPSPATNSAITGISSAGGHVYAVGFTFPGDVGKTLVLENDKG